MKMNISVGNNVKQSQKSLFYNMDVKLRRNINSSQLRNYERVPLIH